MDQSFLQIALQEIKPDPTQPRKQYDDIALQELSASIASNGVLEPILVRKKGKQYMIVFGERRWRASKLAGLETIPCIVKEMTDAQVLEAQLVENMHRQDPHPMDEATAFKRFVAMMKLPIEEIAAKVGKPVFYIKQRLKLVELIVAWQTVFFRNFIKISDALQMAQLPVKTQEMLAETLIDESQFTKPNYKITFEKNQFERFRGNLAAATFDIHDASLHDNGACTKCQFNTSFATLFPNDSITPRCTNITCYTQKTNNSFKLNLEAVKEDPAMLLVKYYGSTNSRITDQLKKENVPVLEPNEYNAIEMPQKPDWEEFKNEHDDLDDAELVADFNNEIHRYDEEFKIFQHKVDSGKYIKAFVVDGINAGTIKYISLTKKGAASVTQQPADTDNEDIATAATIQEEIKRLTDKEQRAKELDRVKVHNQVKETLSNSELYLHGEDINIYEAIALTVIAYSESYEAREYLQKQLHMVDKYAADPYELHRKLDAMQQTESIKIMRKAVRILILSKLVSSAAIEQDPERHAKAGAIRTIAIHYMPDVVNSFDNAQAEKAKERQQKLSKRLAQLNKQLKDAKLPAAETSKKIKQGLKTLPEDSKDLNE